MPSNARNTRFAACVLSLLLSIVLLAAACGPAPSPEARAPAAPTTAAPAPSATPGEDLRPLNAPPALRVDLSETPAPAPRAESAAASTEAPDFLPRRVPRAESAVGPTPTATATRRPAIPTATRPANARELHVPILMYHYISTPPPDADAIRLDLSITPERFEEQIAYFAAQGYHSVSLQTLYDAVTFGKPLPPRPIVFTFDDGYVDAYLNAMPILRRYNFSGTFYVVSGFVGRKGHLTRAQVVEMAEAGMDIQSHSVTHIPMKATTRDVLREEMFGSRRALEQIIGKPVNFFCYPSGQYDALAMEVLKEAGYLAATTVKPGLWQNAALPYEWPRIRVRGRDQLPDLIERMTELQ